MPSIVQEAVEPKVITRIPAFLERVEDTRGLKEKEQVEGRQGGDANKRIDFISLQRTLSSASLGISAAADVAAADGGIGGCRWHYINRHHGCYGARMTDSEWRLVSRSL